ncbi:MAG TPA: histidinol dehydrogenase [Dehalococcoidia bacterium]|nr:histidinol dehydrogenase [Dehalococcoidia bacterium]
MRKATGVEQSISILSKNRGIDLEGDPKYISQFSEAIFGEKMNLLDYVKEILDRVKTDGDKALYDLSSKIDGQNLEQILMGKKDLENAFKHIPSDLREALEFSANRIKNFHARSMPNDWHDNLEGYGQRYIPVNSAAAYIPGGTAKYPSTVLMTAIPARVAGVGEIAITCPMPKSPLEYASVLAAAYISEVDQVYCLGGAQSIGALAYGTESVSKVDFICGPGNVFVTLAKKLVYGDVGIDGLYGPTETVVIADEHANPTLCAADLIAQAEHDSLARPVLITTSPKIAADVEAEIHLRLSRLDRSEIATKSIETQGLISIVNNLEEALELLNSYAPEHVCIATSDPEKLVPAIKNAGMVFVGELSHEVLGDYVAGPSHVMPTAGTARFNSGLGVLSFLKAMPVVTIDSDDSSKLGHVASVIAREEGLTGHAEAAEIRIELT